ncbi:ATP-dependent RNA helicase HrpA [Actinosynnema sp. NPDC047251]|uniref:RNA helicase n=1 Tax=Saccharothrix espanaensis (strain ATCC 51144 / DSM 44229 / JCM 9112 / NBRC 15066 / NRRL 15764) TaxID=1179773 RepID=K0JUG2_SACES|nr:ATP-dependent RNA helicase HrpA [Saccharothrix espanaensis]CCH31485.1 ATP-dependent RNA helicase HrpA [Saccharothrix espanaensis DSM 44229]
MNTTAHSDLHRRLSDLMSGDQRRLGRRLDGARRVRDEQARAAVHAEIAAEIEQAELRVALRRAAVPKITYPGELPVSARKDDIAALIRDHQVVIVAGETGSGKTTQIPKICLELGRGVLGQIGHTQPRRLAARTVAERVAQELGTQLGQAVGYKVRFTDQSGDETLVKLMTDGILLAEIQTDRTLSRYDTIIIDEAHERSLNVDFLLGYLKQLLPRRPDLKVVITSATIDPERFSRHFADAPIIEVSGRTYPVEVRYRPVVDPDDPDADPDRDQTQAVCDAVRELQAEGPGDVLVFLSGEREIRDTADALAALGLPHTEILPLYARLSFGEQHKVFQSHRGRRVVLATNVAETSLTVPGIKYVVDPGTARISRYSNRLKVQRLPIEPISQASANQRKGRCGRVSAGICVRLYSEDSFDARPEFTDPEILRTNLASVILQMTAIGLGDIAAFPFIDPPEARNINDGVQLLHELGAIVPAEQKLTPLGRKLAQLPVDPRLARMVIEADRNGCVREVMVIASALSIQDPRERPSDKQQAADEQHNRFKDPDSDFVAYLNLWQYLREQQKALSSNQFRRLCRAEFLNYLRVREWQDIYSQLRQVAKTLGVHVNEQPAEPRAVHLSLLSGLLSHIGLKDVVKRDPGKRQSSEYLGARNAKFAIFPGSALFRKPPQWVMAAELVETSRLWGRIVARIEPEWAEGLAEHLVKRSYSEPHWEAKRGAVMAMEKVTLYGVPIVGARKVNYGQIDPGLCRELFIRHALVQGEWTTHHKFFHHNRALLDEVAELENRARRRDIVVDDDTLYEFYDQRVGEDVVSARHFDTWWKKTRHTQPDLLTFDKQMLVNDRAQVTPEAYPDELTRGGVALPLTYRFEPGTAVDGVTVRLPLPALTTVPDDALSWQVPGLRTELVVALIRSLPKPVRRNFVPVPDVAAAALSRIDADEPLLPALERELRALTGVVVPREEWQLDQVPEHLKLTFQVVDENNRELAQGKDLAALKQQLRGQLRETLAAAASNLTRTGLTTWDLDELPKTVQRRQSGIVVTAYPALVDKGDSVAVEILDTPGRQAAAMRRGTRRLLLLAVPSPVKLLQRGLTNAEKLTLTRNPHGGVAALLADCISAAVDHLVTSAGGPAWNAKGFTRLTEYVRKYLGETVFDVVREVRNVLDAAQEVELRLAGVKGAVYDESVADVRAQLKGLVHNGFVTEAGAARLSDLHRYLQGIARRLEKLPENVRRDQDWMDRVHQVHAEYRDLKARLPADEPHPELDEVRWMIEELRLSYFAQTIPTRYTVSDKRVFKALDAVPR